MDSLYHQAEQASERYNDARIKLRSAKSRLAALNSDLRREEAALDAVRDQVAGALVAQYQTQGIGAAGQALLSDDPDAFLSGLTTVTAYNERQGAVLQQFSAQAKKLELRRQAAKRQVDAIAEVESDLAKDKASIDKKAAEAKDLLGELETKERERLLAASRAGGRVPLSSVPASGRAKAVVAYALAQVGDAYVWGASGPNAFDCSGFTMMAWAQVGVGLPHSSGAQRGYGVSVSQSQLRPGDLVFYYQPTSHVAIYIGNGMIVHAANPGAGVRIDPLNHMPYSGAVRPG